ncbi:MAG: hypothetical protein A2Y33_05090, partial [Spirochaetes bacterium GWF1_51_8]
MKDWKDMILFRNDLLETAREYMNSKKDYGFGFVIEDWTTDFLRFYRGRTNYNITKNEITAAVTVEKEKKKYTFVLSDPDPARLRKALDDACAIVLTLPPDDDFHSFEDNKDVYKYGQLTDSLEETPLDKKVEILKKISGAAEKYGYKLYGTFITLNVFRHIFNSNIPVKHFYQSPVMLDVKAVSDKNMATVIESFGGNSISLLDLDDFISRLCRKIEYTHLPAKDIEPGAYDVILSPHAAAQLLEFLMMGAYANNLDNGTSFFEGQIGKTVLSPKVSVASDPYHPSLITYPYHGDGSVTGRLPIVEQGVFKSFVTDHYYSKKLGIPKNCSVGTNALSLEKGGLPLDKLIGSIEHGIYISNIHYMNFINEKDTSVTGLTRDGTFLIENGKIANTLPNLRYTVKLSDVFTNVVGIEDR